VHIAHKYLCETLKILHCDISVGNILLYRPDEDKEAKGLLVDFDFAKTIEGDKSSGDTGDADDALDDNDEGGPIFGEIVNTQPTGTKSLGGVWTVCDIYAYFNIINHQ
jgi:Fungal protein kinase